MNKYFIGLVVIVLVALGVWWGVARFSGSDEVSQLQKNQEKYERLMAADLAGGATPEETLRLLVEALRAGDRERAASYFLLDENGSRKIWEEALQAKSNEELIEIADIVAGAEARPESSISENYFKFVVRGENGVVGASINTKFNTFSKVWKIESL